MVAASQAALERKYADLMPIAQGSGDGDKKDLGLIDDWVIQIEEQRLFLNPFSGEWLYFDPLHDSWEHTEFKAGEATFTVRGGLLRAMSTAPGNSKIQCKTCGKTIGLGERFCSGCGAAVSPPADPPCANCGSAIEAGARFCRVCGRAAGAPSDATAAIPTCRACKALLEPEARFCRACGTPA